MPLPYIVAAGLCGLLFGSFLNVCIYRLPRDLSVVMPRSFCPECGKAVRWFDNVPVVSYLLLGGRCRDCSHKIGVRYPLVELSTSAMFMAVAWRYRPGLEALKWGLFEALLIALFWTDLEERILPDELTLGGVLAGLGLAVWVPSPPGFAELFFRTITTVWVSLCNALVGAFFLASPVWLLGIVYARIRKREGLGFGDVKLLMMFGVFLGLEQGLFALLIGSVAGSIIGLAYIRLSHKQASSYELPFGSFLCAGAALVPLLRRI